MAINDDLDRAIAAEREFVVCQLEILRERLKAMDKAADLLAAGQEKRFESGDLFRRQLSDQMAGVMSRNEADVRITGISEKLDIESRRTTERFNDVELRLTSRLDLMQGNKQGGMETKAGIYAFAGFLVSLLVIGGILAAAGVFGGK